MPWKRFVFALGDAACAELVTAFERYLASGSCSHPDPVGLVSEWGGGRREGGVGMEKATGGKTQRGRASPQRHGLRDILFGPLGRHRVPRESQPLGTGQRESSPHRGLVCVPEEIASLCSSRPVPSLPSQARLTPRIRRALSTKPFGRPGK